MKRIGLMGCGKVAGYGHLPALNESEHWDLVSVFDPNPERLAQAQERFNVPQAFTDSDAFFESGLDAVAITSPAPCHKENVLAAARFGKPVLCEKPLAMDEAEVAEMIAVMEKAGLPFYAGFTYRFGADAQRIKRLVDERVVGDVLSLRLIYIWNCHGKYVTDEEGNRIEQPRRRDRMYEGGPLVDCGVHQIDLSRWWLGSEIVRYQSAGAWLEDYEAPDHVYLHMDHANGAHTMIEISYAYCHTAKESIFLYSYDLIGTEGVIRYDMREETIEVRSVEGTTSYPITHGKNFPGMYTAFAMALDTGQPHGLASPEDGLIATRIARTATNDAIRQRNAAKA